MKFSRETLKLYLVTDRRWLGSRDFVETVEEAIDNGVTLVQLREKNLDYGEFLELAKDLKEVCQKHGVPFLINDNIKVAKEVDADGLHIGQGDMALEEARQILGEDKIIGLSCGNLEEARKAKRDGADYIGVGSVFSTGSKKDAKNIGLEGLEEIAREVDLPIVAIGGINKDNILELAAFDIDGVALISAILKEDNIAGATSNLAKLSEEAFYGGGNI